MNLYVIKDDYFAYKKGHIYQIRMPTDMFDMYDLHCKKINAS